MIWPLTPRRTFRQVRCGVMVQGSPQFADRIGAALALLAPLPQFDADVRPNLRAVVRRPFFLCVVADHNDFGRAIRWLDDDSAAAPPAVLASYLAAEGFRIGRRRRERWGRRVALALGRDRLAEEVARLEYQIDVMRALSLDSTIIETVERSAWGLHGGSMPRVLKRMLRIAE